MATEIKVPSVGESISEAVIAEWVLAEGDAVEADQPVAVLETDKANMELPSPVSGVLEQIVVAEGSTVQVGDVIGYIDEGARGDGSKGAPRVTPAARRALADKGVKAEEVEATGPGGRLSKEDVLRHVEERRPEARERAPEKAPEPAKPEKRTEPEKPARRPEPTGGRQEEKVPMTLLRKRVAKRLVEAQQTAALLTTFNEVDMTAILEVRKQYQETFQKEHGVKLGFMSFFVKASIEALKAFPELNARIEDEAIVYHDYYDIGVAVGAPKGLVVPVLRNAERMSFAEVEKTLGDLADRARHNRLTVDELQGGTFTLSNGGVYGSLLSTPIVNPPQSGILGMHKIQERPVALGGQVVIRPMMYLALTYDHRIVDGREAVSFLVRVKDCLENPLRMLLEI